MDVLLEFLRRGQIFNINLGMSDVEIKGLLGEPEDVEVNGPDNYLAKYESLELVYKQRKLYLINLVFYEGNLYFSEHLKLNVKPIFRKGVTIEEIVIALNDNDIGWRIYPKFTEDESLCIITQSNVMIFYGLLYTGLDKLQIVDSSDYEF